MNTQNIKNHSRQENSVASVLTQEEKEYILSYQQDYPVEINRRPQESQQKLIIHKVLAALRDESLLGEHGRHAEKQLSSGVCSIGECSFVEDDEVMKCIKNMVKKRDSELQLKTDNTVFKVYGKLEAVSTVKYLEKEIARVNRTGGNLSVVMINLCCLDACVDFNCKVKVNVALKKLSDSIKRYLRAYDQIGKFGDNELLVVLPEASGEFARVVVRRIEHDAVLKNIVSTALGGKSKMKVQITEYKKGDDVNAILQRVSLIYGDKKINPKS